MSRRLFLGLLIGWLALRALLALTPGYVLDTDPMKGWVLAAGLHGPLRANETTSLD